MTPDEIRALSETYATALGTEQQAFLAKAKAQQAVADAEKVYNIAVTARQAAAAALRQVVDAPATPAATPVTA